MELIDAAYIIVKGFIDAKEERGRTIYGTLVALVSRRNVNFASVWFSREEIPRDIEWDELLRLHAEKGRDDERDPFAVRNEELLSDFLFRSNALNGIAKNNNAKSAEQTISRFCLDQLQLKAVSFLDFVDAKGNDIDYIESLKADAHESEHEADPASGQDAANDLAGGEGDDKTANEIFVKCDPVLDPVNGVAMNELRIGDTIFAKLPEDSVFFKLLAKTHSAFDGTISADVTGILLNELGTATISLSLSDGVSGVMKLSGKVKIKVANLMDDSDSHAWKTNPLRFSSLPNEVVVVGLSCFLLLISALVAIYYIFR
jgi:hypothetical protein